METECKQTIPTSVSTSENLPEKLPPLDSIEFKGGVKSSPKPQVILLKTTGDDVSWLNELSELEQSTVWDNIWENSIPAISNNNFNIDAYLNIVNLSLNSQQLRYYILKYSWTIYDQI